VYLDHLAIRHLKLLRDFRLDFTQSDGTPRMWTVVIGRNGTAKTSILQAIALAAAGSRQVSVLAKPIVGHLVDRRTPRATMQIEASFRFTPQSRSANLHPSLGRAPEEGEHLRSTLSLRPKQTTLAGRSYYASASGAEIEGHATEEPNFDPLDEARADNRKLWFVASYGVGRFLPDPQSRPPLVQPSIERLEPLIDEIDLYLHPTWQAGLIPALRRTFPRVQFVVTTHSPVVLSSLAPEEIVVVDQHPETGDVERFVHDPETGHLAPMSLVAGGGDSPDPRAMTGTDVYRTWFGLDRLTLNPQGDQLRLYLQLATDPFRSDEEEQTLQALISELQRDQVALPRPPVVREPS